MSGEIHLKCEKSDLKASIEFFTQSPLKFKIRTIYPADDPRFATLAGHDLQIRLCPAGLSSGHIRIPVSSCELDNLKLTVHIDQNDTRCLKAPNGTLVELIDEEIENKQYIPELPPFSPQFILSTMKNDLQVKEGRAGMNYRDLVPSRLGGLYIGSHISIPNGGIVLDWVHYHVVHFQMIFCKAGWVKVVYEDQGEPFVLSPGDVVLQPPGIRHQVLESSQGLEVVEISSPAQHLTCADHELSLPNPKKAAKRIFPNKQSFLWHRASEASWMSAPHAINSREFAWQETNMLTATDGMASVGILRATRENASYRELPHAGELLLCYVCRGSAGLLYRQEVGEIDKATAQDSLHALRENDSFVIPPGHLWELMNASKDCEVLRILVTIKPVLEMVT